MLLHQTRQEHVTQSINVFPLHIHKPSHVVHSSIAFTLTVRHGRKQHWVKLMARYCTNTKQPCTVLSALYFHSVSATDYVKCPCNNFIEHHFNQYFVNNNNKNKRTEDSSVKVMVTDVQVEVTGRRTTSVGR